MMNIETMTEQEKSLALSRMAGWIVKGGPAYAFIPGGGLKDYYSHLATFLHYRPEHVTPNLYDPDNMALAWQLLNWMEIAAERAGSRSKLYNSWMSFLPETLFSYSAGEAQRIWLDKILELAVEAGMVNQ